MQEQIKTDSKHASIHEIMSQNKRHIQTQQIAHLFSTPDLSQIDLNQLTHHPYMQLNQIFTFFVHQLENWNRKIINKSITTFYHAELNRNLFILSSLKIISLKKPNQIQRYLEKLTLWYNKNSYNIPQPNILIKKYNPNEEWEIRKTFKSNTPSEIHHYKRRFLCSPDDKNTPFPQNFLQLHQNKQNPHFQSKPHQNKTFAHSKTSGEQYHHDLKFIEPFKQVMKNKDIKLAKLQQNEIRQKRQQLQIAQIHDSWKSSNSRFAEKTCKNFFNGKFIKNKQFLEMTPVTEQRKVQTAVFNKRRFEQGELTNSVKKGRIMTSLGIRKNFKHEQNEAELEGRSMTMKTESNQEAKEESITNWIDKFVVDEDNIDIRSTLNGERPYMRLMSNPFDTGKNKMKKKKR